ncbi:hypothetical protein C1Y40_00322 [Mycobacterium talmoniae]|uniref:Uncharacterized protein n=1 Tax=Mycobacterium talmoniae TaxID=1858794 RepID=A0A2S8BS39_9MYCO|nr:hypothetical protein C1Y40_00322 [Mycobacterium talmoniae]
MAIRTPLLLTRIRVIGRAVSSVSSSGSCGCRVGSPPDSISTSSRPFSRSRRWSTLASTSSIATTLRSSGDESVKQVGQRRLQVSAMSSNRMQVCWVCISGRPRRYADGIGSKLPGVSGVWALLGAVHSSR